MDPLLLLINRVSTANDGDAKLAAQAELVLAVGPLINAFVARRAPADWIEETQQEALVCIATKLPSSQNWDSPKQVWAWCYQVARSKISDAWQKSNSQPITCVDLEELRKAIDASGITDCEVSGVNHDLDYALNLLRASRPPCVDFLWAHYVDDLGFAELAEIYGIQEDAMRKRITRCLEHAQQLVDKHD